ncbi:unnamed protein product [Chrysoparadoxa australica]
MAPIPAIGAAVTVLLACSGTEAFLRQVVPIPSGALRAAAESPNSGQGAASIHQLAREGNTKALEDLLATSGNALVQAFDEAQYTPLHVATYKGHAEAAQVLLYHGAEVNAPNGKRCTALHVAAHEGHTEMIRLLIGAGADLEAKAGGLYDGCTPLHFACRKGQTEAAELLALEFKANIEAKEGSGSETPLYQAVWDERTETARMLVETAAADVEGRTRFGETALHAAAWLGYTSTAKMLLELGAEVSSVNDRGDTPLHWAAHRGHSDTAQLLLDFGADQDKTNAEGRTALQDAQGFRPSIDEIKAILTEETIRDVDEQIMKDMGVKL